MHATSQTKPLRCLAPGLRFPLLFLVPAPWHGNDLPTWHPMGQRTPPALGGFRHVRLAGIDVFGTGMQASQVSAASA